MYAYWFEYIMLFRTIKELLVFLELIGGILGLDVIVVATGCGKTRKQIAYPAHDVLLHFGKHIWIK